MRISDWSSDVCSSDLVRDEGNYNIGVVEAVEEVITVAREAKIPGVVTHIKVLGPQVWGKSADVIAHIEKARASGVEIRSEEHTSELQSLMRISYAVFCLKKKKTPINITKYNYNTTVHYRHNSQ